MYEQAMRFPDVKWILFPPHVAEIAAHGGGTWCLCIEPWNKSTEFRWRVAHSDTGRGSRGGNASRVNFAKAQAGLAAAELEGAASSRTETGKGPASHDPNCL